MRSSFEVSDGRIVFPGVVTGWSSDTQEYTVEYADPEDRKAWYLSKRNLPFHLVMDVKRFNIFISMATSEMLKTMAESLDDRCKTWLEKVSRRGKSAQFSHTLQVREELKECFPHHSECDHLADALVRTIGNQLLFCDGQRFAIGLEHAAYDWVQCEEAACRKWRLLQKSIFERLRDSCCAPLRRARDVRTLSEPREDVPITCRDLGNEVLNVPGFHFSEATPSAQDKRQIALLKISVSSCQHPAFMDKSYEYFSDRMRQAESSDVRTTLRKLREWNELLRKFRVLFLQPENTKSGWLLGVNLWDIFVDRRVCSGKLSDLLKAKLSKEKLPSQALLASLKAFSDTHLSAHVLKDDDVKRRFEELKPSTHTSLRVAALCRIDFHNAPSRYEITKRVEHVYRLVQRLCTMLPESECFQPLRDKLAMAANAPDHMLRVAVVGPMSAGKSYFLNLLFQMFAPTFYDYEAAFSAESDRAGLVPGGTQDVFWVPLETELAARLCAADEKNRAKEKYQFLCPEGMH